MIENCIRGIIVISLLLNLWLSFLFGRWFFANVQAYMQVDALMPDINSEKTLRLQGCGRFVQFFSGYENASGVAVVMKTDDDSLLWMNVLSKRGSKQTLRSGMLEIKWMVDAEGLHELQIFNAGKAVNLP